jgi:hypothetical protein
MATPLQAAKRCDTVNYGVKLPYICTSIQRHDLGIHPRTVCRRRNLRLKRRTTNSTCSSTQFGRVARSRRLIIYNRIFRVRLDGGQSLPLSDHCVQSSFTYRTIMRPPSSSLRKMSSLRLLKAANPWKLRATSVRSRRDVGRLLSHPQSAYISSCA